MVHTEPIFKSLGLLKFTDKLSYCRSFFMHQYRHEKLPSSFTGVFDKTTISEGVWSRHNDYVYQNEPAVKMSLSLKQMMFNWNSLDIELKATWDHSEFQRMLNPELLSQYRYEKDTAQFTVSVATRNNWWPPIFVIFKLYFWGHLHFWVWHCSAKLKNISVRLLSQV